MSASQGISLVGCRHDVIGHALKAIGVLRALAQCAPEGKTDTDAEGWWDMDRACFRVYSPRYPTMEKLREFFAEHYEPTPIIAAWNKSGGVTDKVAVTISARRETLDNFRIDRDAELLALGMKKATKVSKGGELKFTLADPAKLSDAEALAKRANLQISSEQVTMRGVAALKVTIAAEGALAMRGATSKTLNAQSRSRAAFPFVFDGLETMTDENGDPIGNDLAASFWFPLWNRPTNYHELLSFILDSQTRLPAKDCRFSGDFARAVRSQGTDAGFAAFQEFRFKLKGASVPWTTAGRFVPCTAEPQTTLLNELLTPVDANGFLEQFGFNREAKKNRHQRRLPVLGAIDEAIVEPSPGKIIEVLCRLAVLNADLAKSKSLREKVNSSGRVRFIPALSSSTWDAALREFGRDDPEFEIARALASITGHERQPNKKWSEVEPFLGSLVPLKRKGRDWILPTKPEPPSAQAVWSENELCFDLSAILARRHLDSSKDVRPALVGRRAASLKNILAFLRGELDDRRIARLVMGLSLIDWQYLNAGNDERRDRSYAGSTTNHVRGLEIDNSPMRNH